ncbi:helix-turn-helix domain-containing protein [Streptomyces sp. HNM0663]|uniref:Helix-turn-helix domain-containing protein n=1 Tax=Streptomyces chengmaiensis TaxID=3040919 RepID=A0ABT6HJB0_9ACTN|nr:helix-turn-helix domain-containing protein [Streptomyces chengmaiensis]MDH2388670.1 helix-turn-helix domain-containing protein [Streptomyces chengmaiensis]
MRATAPPQNSALTTLRGDLPDRYLTPDDIAELFEVPKETVYQWRKKRTGPPGFRVGKHIRYDPAAVHRWACERMAADAV